ncbi:MAG TPA: error-prone DNA polymerase [Steroidobacteraceae bacterium]|nr:error-prone DNA polymerase [Steroidobacteraceae bacterium]
MYVELHALSNFSFLRGASHPEELIAQAKALNYSGLALTDECSLAGVVRAHVAAKELGLHLIVGSEFNCLDALKLVVLATDRSSYGALSRLVSKARRATRKGCYALQRSDLEGALAGCLILWLPSLDKARWPHQESDGRWLRERFEGRLWIGVELLTSGYDARRGEMLEDLGKTLQLPCVAAGDVHMHRRSRRALQDVLTAIRLGEALQTAGYALFPNGERCMRSLQRLRELYPEPLLAETLNIAERCTFKLDELRYEYPEEIVPAGETPTSHLRALTLRGCAYRWPNGAPHAVRENIEHELRLIAELKFEPFFLTVHDVVEYARSQKILCQGRGSAANSTVCYCLRITEVDPSRMSMLFERFISKERNEPPDIDVDFEHERREEVIQYIYGKYGRERAALAATLICYRPRSALRDVGKALGFDLAQVDRLARAMQWWDGQRIDPERIRASGFDPENPLIGRLIALAAEILGFPRHLSQHVGGFVIARGRLDELVPIENATMPDRTVIQWDKDDLDALGLLKVDVLALGMLTAIRRAFNLVNEFGAASGAAGGLELANVPSEDSAVYDMICRADTTGVFQIESRAQMSMLPRLRPRNFYDLVIEVAIVRPGPIQGEMVHPYLRRRSGEEAVTYPSKEVEAVLKRTLGVPIFQEQVMQLAIVAAGFSPGAADRLRRAMAAWKRKGGLEPFQKQLIDGMRERGYEDSFAGQIFKQILGFGEYGFPECVVGETRVVDADTGRWLTIDEVVGGRASLRNTLACDEELRLRKRKVVRVVQSGVKPVWRLRTALGHEIMATAEHPFMTRGGWRQLGRLKVGDCVATARSIPLSGRRRWPRHQVLVRAIAGLAEILKSRDLSRLASSDLYWDRIVEIESAGERETYDLEIEGNHNFLANHFVVHNSHSASFALLVYTSAWLKHYEPAAFCAALINSQPMGFYAPAQLVRDARGHGVEVRAADVTISDWDCTLERREDGRPALRLGLRLVKHLSQEGAARLLAARRQCAFGSIADMAERAALDRRDLEALAAADALSPLSGHRYRAVWQVTGVERALPLLPASTAVEEGIPLLRAPREGQDIVADYGSLGLTLRRHPLALLRDQLKRRGVVPTQDLWERTNGKVVITAGLVITRQRPGSAGGVTFVTLEDETGYVNLIVWNRVAIEQRAALLESRLLEVQGKLQREGDVQHVIAARLTNLSSMLGELVVASRNFH